MLFNIEPLRMWVHKVLPVVYDDSLSYYEVLAKTVKKLNEVIDLTDEQTKFIQEFSDNLTDAINKWEEGLTDEWTNYKNRIDEEWENYKSNTNEDIEIWKHLKENEIERAVAEGISAFAEYFEGLKNQAVDAADRAGDEADRAEAAAGEAAENAVEAVMPTLEGIFDNRYAFKSAIGSPLVAQTAAEMTDTNKIYVYVGNETGYVNGNWYYYDGTAWESGGVYNSVAVVTDTTLTQSGVPADAKATGDEITDLKSAINIIEVGYKQYLTSDIIQGSYNADGSVAPNPNRIRISGFVELNAGDTLRFKSGTNTASLLYGLYNENKDFQGDSTWYSSEHTITTDKHIYVICIFKNSTGTSITPADFDATVVKTLSTKNAIVNLSEMLDVSVSPTTDQIIENRFITEDGTLSSESVNFNATDYLNIRDIVSDSLTIRGTVYGYAGLSIYDANRTVLLSVTGNNASIYGITPKHDIQTFSIPRPAESYYARLSAWKSAYTQPSDLKVIGGGYGDLNSRLSRVEREIDSIDTGTLSDKKVLVIGDSISTDAYGNYRKWVTDLINTGFFDGEKVTNSSQHATGFVARYDNRPNDFITRIKAISDPSQYDLVIVFGGINDYIQNIPMGSESGTDYTVSFKPAVNEFFNYLIQNFTQARLCVLLPLRTYATWQNSVGEYQQAYGDYIKQVAQSYCLPVLNLTAESGFCPYIATFRNMWTLQPEGYQSHDGVHPNEEYERRFLAPMIKHFLQGLM